MTTADLTGTTFDIPEPSTAEPLHCQDCEFVTHSLQQLRLHRTKVHRKRTYRIHHPPLEHVMHEGLPQCTHCAKSFSTWKAFHTHVERGTCQALHQHHQASSAQMLLQAAVRRAGDLPFRGEQMPHLQNTDLGCKILEYIRAHQWQELSHDDAACKQLTHHCVVCGQWQSRTQSMNRHLREAHASLLDGVFQTGIQLTRMWATTSPCQFCGVTFQRSHMCAALTQVALIMLNAKSLTPETQALTCALCDLQCADEAQLRAHLRSHTQSMSSGAWMPSRDQIPGSPACAHCGACFETSSGVQRHITSGQCPHYDATRTTEPTPVSPKWNPYLHEGRLADLWNNQDDRAQLTLCCQHCGHQAARPMDLMNHLRAQHGALWHEARLTLAWLISATADTHGCCCHPALKKHTTGHQCIPLAQLAMLFHRSSGSLCIPHPLPLPEEDEWMSTTADAFEVLEAVMVKREFPFLWTHPLLLAHLSTKCLQCNEDHGHRSYTAIALRLHLAERHASIDTFPHPLHRMLVECFEQTIPDDTTCHACQMVIQLPRDTTTDMTMPESRARAARVQEHFQLQCPVVYQSLLILTRTPQSNDGGSARDGCGLPDGPDLPEPWTDDVELPATMGGKRLHPKKATPTMDSRPRRRRRVQGTAADAPMHGPDGQAAPAPGDGSQHAQSTRLICDFFHSRSTGHVAPSCEVVSGLEDQAGPGQDSELSTVADISGTGHLPEAIGTVHGDLPGTTARRASPTAEETAGPLARCHVALHGVGCSQQCPDLEQASQTNQHGPDEIPAGGLGRICATFSKRCPISCLGPHPARGQDDSLETPTPDDKHGSDQHPGQVGGELHLDSRGSQSEEACAKDVRIGTTVTTTSPSHQREGEGQGQGRPRLEAPENCQATRQLAADDHPELCLKRSELLQACTQMVLLTHASQCFENSAFCALLWGLLCMQSCSPSTIGPKSSELMSFLHTSLFHPVSLRDFEWFAVLLTAWTGESGQGDATEFTQTILSWFQSPSHAQTWKKIAASDTGPPLLDDKGDLWQPITVHMPDQYVPPTLKLTHLLHTWSQEHDMRKGLIQAAPLICIHVERVRRLQDGRLIKYDWPISLHGEVQVPILHDQTLRFEPYEIVSAVAHQGIDAAGHCQAALKHNDDEWWITDDGCLPTRMQGTPSWFASNITLVWLCRKTVYGHPAEVIHQASQLPGLAH
eukprot:Skav226469  [mRNA]  locus=scaffold1781:177248:180844:+ [translate_table: standard]